MTVYTFDTKAGGGATVDGATPALADFSPAAMVRAGTVAYSAAAAVDGPMGLRVVTLTTGASLLRLSPGAASKTLAFRAVVTLPARPSTGGVYLVAMRNTADATAHGLYYKSDGALETYGAGGSYIGKLVTAGNTTPGEVLDWATQIVVGSSATTGTVTSKVYPHGSTTAKGSTVSSTTANLGTANIDRIDLGSAGSTPEALTIFFDSVQAEPGRTSEIPPLAAPGGTAPVVSLSATASTLNPGQTGTVTAAASDPDGTIASYAWTASAGLITGSGAAVTFRAPSGVADSTATITCTVTDNSGATAQASVGIECARSNFLLCTSAGVRPLAVPLLSKPGPGGGGGGGGW